MSNETGPELLIEPRENLRSTMKGTRKHKKSSGWFWN